MKKEKRSFLSRKGLSVIASLCMLAQTSYASTEQAEELDLSSLFNIKVTTASKREEKITDAPGIMTVVSKAEIEGFAAKDLGEVLRRVVGAEYLPVDVFPGQSFVLRGTEVTPYNNRVLFLVDGRPLRDPLTAGMHQNLLSQFPLEAISHIEIVRGAGSVLYGSSAFASVVNLITVKPVGEDDDFSMSGSVSMGSFNENKQSVSISGQKGIFSGLVVLNHNETDGFNYQFKDYGETEGNHDFENEGYGGLARFKIWDFTINANYLQAKPYALVGSNESWPLTKNASYQEQTTKMLDVGYSRTFRDIITTKANYTRTNHFWSSGAGASPEQQAMEPHPDTGISDLGELTVHINPKENLNFVIGAGIERSEWSDVKFRGNTQSSQFGYIQGDWTPVRFAKLIAGVQYNKIERIDGHFSPRFGLVSNITDHWGAKVLYEEAFRKGSVFEMAFNNPVFQGNLEIEPEKIKTLSGQIFFDNGKLNSAVTAYQSRMVDVIYRDNLNPVGKPLFLYKNSTDDWTFWGLEYEGRYQVLPELTLFLNGSYHRNEDENGVEDFTLHPYAMAKGGILYTKDLFTVGVYTTNFSKAKKTTAELRPSSKMINENPDMNNFLSAKVTIKPTKYVKLSLEVDNILDQYMAYPDYANKGLNSFYPLSGGRTMAGKITCNF